MITVANWIMFFINTMIIIINVPSPEELAPLRPGMTSDQAAEAISSLSIMPLGIAN